MYKTFIIVISYKNTKIYISVNIENYLLVQLKLAYRKQCFLDEHVNSLKWSEVWSDGMGEKKCVQMVWT